ncbi:MAG: glycosyl hydrolase family 65 protein [Cyanobacteria bacterium P01_D01_bin.44]
MANREIRDWELIYTNWDPQQQPLREALCALGNGYLVTRGAFEEVHPGGVHYPGTYLAGGYNRLETEIAGHIIENEDLVNWPNWLSLNFRPEGSDWFSLDSVDLLAFELRLDIYRGMLHRTIQFRDTHEREFSLSSCRFVHMANPHLAGIEWRLISHNWSGQLEICSTLDGSIINQNVARYRQLSNQHLDILDTGFEGEDAIFLTVGTQQSHIRMTQASRVHIFEDGIPVPTQRTRQPSPDRIAQHLWVPCQAQKELRIEKIIAIHTSRDFAISEPTLAARKLIRRAGCFAELCQSHQQAWRQLWSIADIQWQDGAQDTQFVLRLHIFHLLQSVSTNSIDQDIGVPARGWHGEAYRGHIFWDELFIFPFLTLRLPELTRSLLMYRYRRLDEARSLAKRAGYQGAMFPWQSGSDGREESQMLHLNPQSGRWLPDTSSLQRHVNVAIAYNVWQYYQATDDTEFLAYYGAEIILEIVRFWASTVIYNQARERYEIRGVMGPDEFHTHYPDASAAGLNNNAYTNFMAAWVLRCANQTLQVLDDKRRQDLRESMAISDEEIARWDHISRRLFIPFHDGVISQFEGYETLKEFDWQAYREKYGEIRRLDRILEAEGEDVNCYKASKQADALMLFYLFSAEALQDLFEHMGYEFSPNCIPQTIDYYMQRTSHGSTLSQIVHSWVLARADRDMAWKLFDQALHSDIDDIQGGTTPEGIHLGAMAGTVDLMQRVHTGIEMRDNVLWFNPLLPHELSTLRLRIRYRGNWLSLQVTNEMLTVSFDYGGPYPACVGFQDNIYEMTPGETREFEIASR